MQSTTRSNLLHVAAITFWLYAVPIAPYIMALTLTNLWGKELLSFAAGWTLIISASSLALVGALHQNAVRSDKAEFTPKARVSFYLFSANVVLGLTAGSIALFIGFINKYHTAQPAILFSDPSFLLISLNLALISLSTFVTYNSRIFEYF